MPLDQLTPYREIASGQLFRQGRRLPPCEGTIWPLIEARLRTDPSRIVLTDGTREIDAAALLDAIEALPWPGDLPPGSFVAVRLPRGLASVAATLAVWRHGAVYVPIASDSPAQAVHRILVTCKPALVLCDAPPPSPSYSSHASAALFGRTIGLWTRDDGAPPATADSALAYVAHTSGSTGDPKGVMITHAAFLNRLRAMRDLFGIGEDDVCLYKTPASFDVHLWEFALPLLSGARAVVHEQDGFFDLGEVVRLLLRERVTIVGFVPVLLRALVRSARFRGADALRTIICGGEPWSPALALALREAMPGRALYNAYGPTETTMVVANWRIPQTGPIEEIQLGAPGDNTSFLVETTARDIDGNGVPGRLLIGGDQLAAGYVEGLSSQRFVHRVVDGVLTRFYDTGDLVRLRPDTGALVYAGRDDLQVKVNGVRVELLEIEEALAGLERLEIACAYLSEAGQLCAAYVTADAMPIDRHHLAAHCAERLAAPLIPSSFRHLTTMPVTSTGKLDRARVAAQAP